MIFTVFTLARQELSTTRTSIIVISPLKSTTDDQISEVLSLNFTAMELLSVVFYVLSLFEEFDLATKRSLDLLDRQPETSIAARFFFCRLELMKF